MPLAFSNIDWWIVGVYLLIATVPGFFCRKYIKGQEDFLIAGRSLSIWLATATLTATEMGLVTVMYMAQMGFENGLSAMVLGVIAFCATLFVGLTGFMVSGLRRSGATTVAEYYQQRYSPGVRVLGGLIIATAGILNYGVFLKVEANFIRIITEVPDLNVTIDDSGGGWKLTLAKAAAGPAATASDPTSTAPGPLPPSPPSAAGGARSYHLSSIKLVMSILVVIVLLYTLLGGMVSVVLTDYIQFIVLTLGIGLTTWWILAREPAVGGMEGVVEAVRVHRPYYGLDPTITVGAAGMGWLWIIWQTMHWLGTNTWQTQAFRTAATDSPRTARVMWSLTAVNYFGRAIIPMLWGAAAIAYLYNTRSPADLAGMDTLEAMPRLLHGTLPPVLIGFMCAGMLAALMSTHSSYMLAWSGVLTEDLIAPIARAFGLHLPGGLRIWITRFFILCLGAFLIRFGLWYEFKKEVWGYLAVTGTMYVSGSTALLALGLYWRRASTAGAYLGLLFGAAPGLVYLTTRFLVLAGANGRLNPPEFVRTVDAFLTDPKTGVMSFPLAILGMILGSVMFPRRLRVPAFETIPLTGGAA
ncbi:MAG: sodium:solute symporter family protein [Phycisphaerae bacterium]|jgi:SSS family solute:Na+ symporter